MDLMLLAVVFWAVDSPKESIWSVLVPAATAATALITAVLGYRAYQAKRVADNSQYELEKMKVSVDFFERSLLRSDKEVSALEVELADVKASHAKEIAAMQDSLTAAHARIDQLQAAFAEERRMHGDRVRALRRQIRELGGTDGGNDD